MRIVRFAFQGRVKYGLLQENQVQGLRGNPFGRVERPRSAFVPDGATYRIDEVRLCAPCLPSKIIGVGLNYYTHAKEGQKVVPSVPLIFIKPPTAAIGPDDKIILKNLANRVDYEGELGVVIGKKAKDVQEDKAREYVLGYTCFNDVSDRNAQKEDNQATRGKGYDTFAPFGPWIETDVVPDDLKIETYLNGELRQSARTRDLIFNVSKLVSFISAVMTLLPGDLIATGTPAGIGQMNPGDVVEVKIEKIGTLRNFVVKEG